MSAVLTLLTSKKTTLLAALSALALLFFDADFIATLHGLGITDLVTAKLVSFAKVVSIILAALGYSPLKRPTSDQPSS